MYVPPAFRMDDAAEMHALLRAAPLGTIVSHDAAGFDANHVPFVLHEDLGERGVLRTHLARANPQADRLVDGAGVLVVFRAADGYVTPSWYPSKRAHGKVVPTWNFLAVHVEGTVTRHTDEAWLDAHLDALTRQQEAGRDHPWTVGDAPAPFLAQMKRAIVGIEIAITATTGKKKVGQNRDAADRAGIIEGWTEAGDPASLAMAEALSRAGGPGRS